MTGNLFTTVNFLKTAFAIGIPAQPKAVNSGSSSNLSVKVAFYAVNHETNLSVSHIYSSGTTTTIAVNKDVVKNFKNKNFNFFAPAKQNQSSRRRGQLVRPL